MAFVKLLHVVFVFVWVGSLMMLTRFMGYHVKENPDTQMRLAKMYKRTYNFVQFPSMIMAVALGLILWAFLDLSYKPGWFHFKLAMALGLIICDLICGAYVRKLNSEPDLSSGKKYKILHGFTGLFLIAVLSAGFLVRDKKGEIIHQHEKLLQEKPLAENPSVE